MSRDPADSQQARPAGSPSESEPVFLLVGKLRKPHGLRGELVMEVWTEFPERLQPGLTVYLGSDYTPVNLQSVRQHASYLLIAFEGVDNPEQAGTMRNQWVYVPTDQVPPLSEGEYYQHQIIGLQVTSEDGQYLGDVTEVLETGSNDVLVVHPQQGQDILLPFTDEVIVAIDLEGGWIRVHLLPGLLP